MLVSATHPLQSSKWLCWLLDEIKGEGQGETKSGDLRERKNKGRINVVKDESEEGRRNESMCGRNGQRLRKIRRGGSKGMNKTIKQQVIDQLRGIGKGGMND